MEDENKDIEITEIETQGSAGENQHDDTVDNGDDNNVEATTLPEVHEPESTPESEDSKEQPKQEEERMFTQAEVDKMLNKALAKKLPPKKEMEEFKAWKEAQKTEAEKAAEREKRYLEIEQANESLKHENAVIKAGVRAEDVDYVLFKVEKMDGDDFEANLKSFLSANDKFTAPKVKTVEGAKHETKTKGTITKKELDEMSYRDRLKFFDDNPAAYKAAMEGK